VIYQNPSSHSEPVEIDARFTEHTNRREAWRLPLPDFRHVEQDLIIFRTLCDLFNAAELQITPISRGACCIAFYGTSALPHGLHLPSRKKTFSID
jgi:hypothetical protein